MSSFDPLPRSARGPDLGVPPTRQATPVRSGRAEDACLLFRKCRQVGMHRFIEQERRGHPRLHKTKTEIPMPVCQHGAWVICRIPSSARDPWCQAGRLVETTEQWVLLAWAADLVASDTLFVERLASASLATPPACFVSCCFAAFPLPPARCAPAAHHSPPEIPSRPFHPIYARETVSSGKRKDPPPPSFPSPGFTGWSSQCDPRL